MRKKEIGKESDFNLIELMMASKKLEIKRKNRLL